MLKSHLRVFLLLITLIVVHTYSGFACNLTKVQLDSVVQVGSEYDIFLTTYIGAGKLGAVSGAEDGTRDFSYSLYTSCTDTVEFSYFTPFIVSDTLACTQTAFGPINSFGSQGTIGYFDLVGSCPNGFTCVNSTLQCGLVHTQIVSHRFRVDVIPDSIVVHGLEGNGNPIAGCFPSSDVRVYFDSVQTAMNFACCQVLDNTPPEITCPANVTSNDCGMLAYWSPPLVIENCGVFTESSTAQSGDAFPLGSTLVAYTVTDSSGNMDSCSFTVTVILPTLLDSLSSPTDSFGYQVPCAGDSSGSIAAFPSGGCPPYTYLWSTGETTPAVTGLAEGSYWVEVTDSSGQVRLDTTDVVGPPIMTMFLFSGPDTVCPGDSTSVLLALDGGVIAGREICVYPQGGGTPISCHPAQSGPVSVGPLGAGTYFFEGSDANGCTIGYNLNVIQGVIPVVSLGTDTTICYGTSLSLDGGAGASYLWNTGATSQVITVNSAGTYSVDITNAHGCIGTDTVEVSLAPGPVAQFSEALTGNLTYQFTDNSSGSPFSYLWDFGDGNTSTQANPLHTYSMAGNYTVCLTTTNSCGSDTSCMQYVLTSAASSTPDKGLFSIYPNPGTGIYWLEASRSVLERTEIKIYDALGRIVGSKTLDGAAPGQQQLLDLSGFAKGQYWLQYRSGEEVGVLRIQQE